MPKLRPHDSSCLIAIYTGATSRRQNQNLAYSNDRGRSWTVYAANPVIDLRLADFRDPKVFWYRPGREWVMVVALPPQHQVRFFGSTDLKHWTALSDFGRAGAVGGAWECPDLFELPVEGQPGETRWVLSVNVNPGGVAGGSGDQYFVGYFDGTRFQDESPGTQVLWADYGKDFYASTTFSDVPLSDGRRVWMGWLNNWEYAAAVPTTPWRGALTIPRVLTLRRFPEVLRLVQQPVIELGALRGQHVVVVNQRAAAANHALQARGMEGDTLEIQAEIDPGDATEVGFRVRKGASEERSSELTSGNRSCLWTAPVLGRRPSTPGFPAGKCPRSTHPADVRSGCTSSLIARPLRYSRTAARRSFQI